MTFVPPLIRCNTCKRYLHAIEKKVEKEERPLYMYILYILFQGVYTCLRPEARLQGGPAWAVVRVVV